MSLPEPVRAATAPVGPNAQATGPRLVRTALLVATVTALLVPALGPVGAAPPGTRLCDVPTDEPDFADDAEVRTWTGDVPSDLTGGPLHVQSYRAGSWIVPWDRPGWRVQVGEVDPQDQLEVVVDARDEERFGLTVEVARRDEAIPLEPVVDVYAQVKVRVPDLVYEQLVLRNAPDDGAFPRIGGVQTAAPAWRTLRSHGIDADALDLRMEIGSANVTDGLVDRVTAETTTGQVGLVNLSSDRTEMATESGALCIGGGEPGTLDVNVTSGQARLRDLGARTVDLEADSGWFDLRRVDAGSIVSDISSGELGIETVRAGRVDVTGDNADLVARGLAVTDLRYDTDNGDLDADLFPLGNSTWNLTADNGRIALHVPTGSRYGYDVNLSTEVGDPSVDIPGTRTVAEGRSWVHARTIGYADRTVRTRIDVAADNGELTADSKTRSSAPSDSDFTTVPSAAAGIGAAAAATGLVVLLWPKIKTVAWPLYTRLTRDELLDNRTRQEIVDLVNAEPGIHFSGVKRRLGVGRGILEHHLDRLVEMDLLDEADGETYRCYFPHGRVDRRVMDVAEIVRSDGARSVLEAVRRRPGASLTELAEAAGVSGSTAGYHLDKLVEVGLVARDRDGGSLSVHLTDLGEQAIAELALA